MVVARRLAPPALLLALVALAPACALDDGAPVDDGIASTSQAIVNGQSTMDFPATGMLLSGTGPRDSLIHCSGTLIGCDTFLTAAHCVCPEGGANCQDAIPSMPYQVFFQHAGFFKVESIHVPETFNGTDDIAVLRLAEPVSGIKPIKLADKPLAIGSEATIVGFGNSGGDSKDYGLKQFGSVVTSECPSLFAGDTLACWAYDGEGSNTCGGDSGGPLFMRQDDGELVLAGITGGGIKRDCTEGDHSYDTEVVYYRDFISSVAGDPDESCGDLVAVGDRGYDSLGDSKVIAPEQGALAAGSTARVALDVPEGAAELRITFNATVGSDFKLFIKHGASADAEVFDCETEGAAFGSCSVPNPAPGAWHATLEATNNGDYQLTGTVLFSLDGVAGCSAGGRSGLTGLLLLALAALPLARRRRP